MDASAEPIRRIDNPGIKAEGGLLHELRREVANLLQRSQLGFPGAQPVSFARRHLQDLMTQEYVPKVPPARYSGSDPSFEDPRS